LGLRFQDNSAQVRLVPRSCGVLFFAAVTVPLLIGCNPTDFQNQSKPSSSITQPCEKTESTHPDRQRFKTVDVYPVGMRPHLALDSDTGQLCRTWNWQTNGGRSPWNRLPTCASLSGQPDGPTGVIEGQ